MRTAFVSLFVLGGIWGCASETASEGYSRASASSLSLSLVGDGANLHLRGSPVDPAYEAKYPVTGVSKMVVSVKKTGDLVASCWTDKGRGDCDDLPFFVKFRTTANGKRVQVFD